MRAEEIRDLLSEKGYKITDFKRLPNETGFQIRLQGGEILNVFDKGKLQHQCKQNEELKALLKGVSTSSSGQLTPS